MVSATDFSDLGRIVVIIPTFNELTTLPTIVSRVRSSVPEAHILVADDNSPDGTGRLADELAEADDHILVLLGLGKEGLGGAYLAGFAWALQEGYDVVVEMDADASTGPRRRRWRPLLLRPVPARGDGRSTTPGCGFRTGGHRRPAIPSGPLRGAVPPSDRCR